MMFKIFDWACKNQAYLHKLCVFRITVSVISAQITVMRSPHISDFVNKASSTLNFINCSSSKCSNQVKESAYLMMVRSQLEDAFDIWDPHCVGDIMELEKVATMKNSPLDVE